MSKRVGEVGEKKGDYREGITLYSLLLQLPARGWDSEAVAHEQDENQ